MKTFMIALCFVLSMSGTALAGSGIYINGEEVPAEEAKEATVENKGPVYKHGRDVTSPEDRAHNAEVERRKAREKEQEKEQAAEDKRAKKSRSIHIVGPVLTMPLF